MKVHVIKDVVPTKTNIYNCVGSWSTATAAMVSLSRQTFKLIMLI